jgi:hypothetical protein
MEPRRPRYETTISGEELRRQFEELLDLREPVAHGGGDDSAEPASP